MWHERTDIYRKAIQLMKTAQKLLKELPRGFSWLAEQLRQSTSSVARNYAEGYYQRSRAQRNRYYEYALNSARESSASFDTAVCFEAADPETAEKGKRLSLDLVQMLSRAMRASQRTRPG